MRRTVLLVLIFLALGAGAAHAQEVQPGARVRVTVPSLNPRLPLVGTVASVDGETLVLREDGRADGATTIPLDAIRRLEVSTGQRTVGAGRARGARVGAIAGFVLGFVGGFVVDAGQDIENADLGASAGTGLLVGAGGAAGGALLGGFLGGRAREMFIPVALPGAEAPRVSVSPARGGGTAVTVTLRFE